MFGGLLHCGSDGEAGSCRSCPVRFARHHQHCGQPAADYRYWTGSATAVLLVAGGFTGASPPGSIISKKGAESLSALVLDVKFGHAALFKDLDSAKELAQLMVSNFNDSKTHEWKKSNILVHISFHCVNFPCWFCLSPNFNLLTKMHIGFSQITVDKIYIVAAPSGVFSGCQWSSCLTCHHKASLHTSSPCVLSSEVKRVHTSTLPL